MIARLIDERDVKTNYHVTNANGVC